MAVFVIKNTRKRREIISSEKVSRVVRGRIIQTRLVANEASRMNACTACDHDKLGYHVQHTHVQNSSSTPWFREDDSLTTGPTQMRRDYDFVGQSATDIWKN